MPVATAFAPERCSDGMHGVYIARKEHPILYNPGLEQINHLRSTSVFTYTPPKSSKCLVPSRFI